MEWNTGSLTSTSLVVPSLSRNRIMVSRHLLSSLGSSAYIELPQQHSNFSPFHISRSIFPFSFPFFLFIFFFPPFKLTFWNAYANFRLGLSSLKNEQSHRLLVQLFIKYPDYWEGSLFESFPIHLESLLQTLTLNLPSSSPALILLPYSLQSRNQNHK